MNETKILSNCISVFFRQSSLTNVFLSGILWKELTGANVIIQVHKVRPLLHGEDEVRPLLHGEDEQIVSQMREAGIEAGVNTLSQNRLIMDLKKLAI